MVRSKERWWSPHMQKELLIRASAYAQPLPSKALLKKTSLKDWITTSTQYTQLFLAVIAVLEWLLPNKQHLKLVGIGTYCEKQK